MKKQVIFGSSFLSGFGDPFYWFHSQVSGQATIALLITILRHCVSLSVACHRDCGSIAAHAGISDYTTDKAGIFTG